MGEVGQSEITRVHLFTGYGTWIRLGEDDGYEYGTTRGENDARRRWTSWIRAHARPDDRITTQDDLNFKLVQNADVKFNAYYK